MSEVRLVLRDADREISGTCHGSTADRIIAALSAEPETIEELEAACARFERPSEHRPLAWFRPGVNDEPYDAGLVVIDLAARLIACDSTYSSASHQGSVSYHNGKCATDMYVNYRLPDDWQIIGEAWNWRPYSESRRRNRLAIPPLDPRAVLYGRPLLEFIARECFQVFHNQPSENPEADDDDSADESNWRGFDDDGPRRTDAEYTAVRDIHARWLLEPRADLHGQAPRDVLLSRLNFIELDLQDREFQWTKQGNCPPGLTPNSHAYRFAGFGRHEIVIYYYLVRRLAWSCRDSVTRMLTNPQASLMTVGDFLATEIDRLKEFRDEWLDTPDTEYHGRTPSSIIDRERQRLPEGMSGEDATIDHDCPLCQMMADDLGPMFWHLDGCNMDDEFAFPLTQRGKNGKQSNVSGRSSIENSTLNKQSERDSALRIRATAIRIRAILGIAALR